MRNPLYVFEDRHVGIHAEEDLEEVHATLHDYLTDLGAQDVADELWGAFESGDEDLFNELVREKAIPVLQELTDPEFLWIFDDTTLALVVAEPEYAELGDIADLFAANPLTERDVFAINAAKRKGGALGVELTNLAAVDGTYVAGYSDGSRASFKMIRRAGAYQPSW